MGRDPNELYSEQRRRSTEQQPPIRTTMETVHVEKQNKQISGAAAFQRLAVRVIAVLAGLGVLYLLLDLIF